MYWSERRCPLNCNNIPEAKQEQRIGRWQLWTGIRKKESLDCYCSPIDGQNKIEFNNHSRVKCMLNSIVVLWPGEGIHLPQKGNMLSFLTLVSTGWDIRLGRKHFKRFIIQIHNFNSLIELGSWAMYVWREVSISTKQIRSCEDTF